MKNKMGIYYAYWEHNWEADFVPYLSRVKSLGFDVLEINAGILATLNTSERKRLRDASLETRVPMSCCFGLPPSSDMAFSIPAARKAGLAYLGRSADPMVACGIDRLMGPIYSCWPGTLEGRQGGKQQAFGWSVAGMKEAIKKAGDLGLTDHLRTDKHPEDAAICDRRWCTRGSAEAVGR